MEKKNCLIFLFVMNKRKVSSNSGPTRYAPPALERKSRKQWNASESVDCRLDLTFFLYMQSLQNSLIRVSNLHFIRIMADFVALNFVNFLVKLPFFFIECGQLTQSDRTCSELWWCLLTHVVNSHNFVNVAWANKELFLAPIMGYKKPSYRHTPKAWRETEVIFLPKPGKDSYDIPKAYHPISLSIFLLKTLERLVT